MGNEANFFKAGVPLLIFMVGGSMWLSQFMRLKVETQDIRSRKFNDTEFTAPKSASDASANSQTPGKDENKVRKEKKKMSLEEEWELMKPKTLTDDYKMVKIERPTDE